MRPPRSALTYRPCPDRDDGRRRAGVRQICRGWRVDTSTWDDRYATFRWECYNGPPNRSRHSILPSAGPTSLSSLRPSTFRLLTVEPTGQNHKQELPRLQGKAHRGPIVRRKQLTVLPKRQRSTAASAEKRISSLSAYGMSQTELWQAVMVRLSILILRCEAMQALLTSDHLFPSTPPAIIKMLQAEIRKFNPEP